MRSCATSTHRCSGCSAASDPAVLAHTLLWPRKPVVLGEGAYEDGRGAAAVLRRNLWIYGVGGILIPFPGIKLVDMVLAALHWV